jgi:hypothetical protein
MPSALQHLHEYDSLGAPTNSQSHGFESVLAHHLPRGLGGSPRTTTTSAAKLSDFFGVLRHVVMVRNPIVTDSIRKSAFPAWRAFSDP